MVVDRQLIARDVVGAGQISAFGLVPPGVANYQGASYAWAMLSTEERLAEARRLYAAAGYSAANPLVVEIRYNTSENHRRIALAIASMWKERLGIDARLINQEWKVMLQTRQDTSAWQVMRYGWIGDYNDAYSFLEIFQSTHGQNFTGFADARYDGLLAAATRERDLERRAELMRLAEQRVLDAYPILPVYFYTNKHLVKPYVRGFRANIMDHNYSRHFRVERNSQ
jgi:oligopeptide transport system substrate-binding protein